MPITPLLVRCCAVAGPALLLLYGLLRFFDGRDGSSGHGLYWNLGHSLFFAAMALLGVLAVSLRRLADPDTRAKRAVATVATVAVLAGVACFLWVILGDLFAELREAAPLPGPLEIAGPLLFQLGMLVLLVQLVTARPRRFAGWCPVAVCAGFLAIGANLDLLPLGAVLIAAGLAPLARPRPVVPAGA